MYVCMQSCYSYVDLKVTKSLPCMFRNEKQAQHLVFVLSIGCFSSHNLCQRLRVVLYDIVKPAQKQHCGCQYTLLACINAYMQRNFDWSYMLYHRDINYYGLPF